MRRGEIVTVAAGGEFGGKPRPALVIQSDALSSLDTVLLALFSAKLTDSPLVRLRFQPTAENGLVEPSDLMAEIIIASRKDRIGKVIGRLGIDDMARVDRRLVALLGLAG